MVARGQQRAVPVVGVLGAHHQSGIDDPGGRSLRAETVHRSGPRGCLGAYAGSINIEPAWSPFSKRSGFLGRLPAFFR